jgi:hypothetical protein
MSCDITWFEITPESEKKVLDKLRWASLHRCDTLVFTYENTGKKVGVLRIPLICMKLDQDKEGNYFCKDYANRPQVCKDYLCPKVKGTPAK